MVVVIQDIQKKVLQQQQSLQLNVHYTLHVHIVIVNNVHHLINMINLLNIIYPIHHQRQIRQLIKIFKQRISFQHNHYQLVDLIHILNHYRKLNQ